ncbi:MAG: hypothetical protein QM785_16845 [Pyrinomonadaceae bacterium]
MNKFLLLLVVFFTCVSAVEAQSGTISGKLVYPGDGIPRDLVVCAKSIDVNTAVMYCSNGKASSLRAAKVRFKLNFRTAVYEAVLPAGTYQLYATTSEMPGHKAFYNDFVRCGMSVHCHSKRPISVKVDTGQRVKGITIGDFWE